MIFRPAGTLKIIKSVELSSISRFPQYARTASKYHSPGLLLVHVSGSPGIENALDLLQNLSKTVSLQVWSPRLHGPQKLRKVIPQGGPKITEKSILSIWPLTGSPFGPPLVPTGSPVAPNHHKMSPKGYPNVTDICEKVSQTNATKQ